MAHVVLKESGRGNSMDADVLRKALRKATDAPYTVDQLPGGDVVLSSDDDLVLILGRLT